MNFTSISKSVWIDLLKGTFRPNLESLALKILLSRLILQYRTNSSDETLSKSLEELKAFIEKNEALPNTQKDLEKIAAH